MATYSEQVSAWEAKLASNVASMKSIMDKAAADGATLDASQKEEYDTFVDDNIEIEDHLKRLRPLEKANLSTVKPVDGKNDKSAGESRQTGVTIQVRNKELPKGTAFTRYVIALARAKGNLMQAHEISKNNEQWMAETPEIESVIKAAVAAGTTTDTTWALPLVQYTQMTSEFIELLRPATIIGRIPGLRRVPFNITMPKQTSSSTVGWVGEGSPKPVSALGFETVTLRWAKIAGIVVISEELARLSNPAAEGVVRQDLIDTIVQFMDRQFVDPTVAAVSGVNPASITNGITPVTATGTTAAAFRADVKSLFAAYHAANLSRAGATWIMTETMLQSLAMMPNALGQPEFKGLDQEMPTLYGLPVVASENIPATNGSPADGSLIILFKPNEIYLADDGGVTVDASREASVQMDSAPDSPQTSSTTLVSLWQTNRIGIRAERWINWDRRRDEAVQFISGANYSE